MAQNESQVKKLAKKKPHERTEAEWDAIWDAQSLARAEQIKADASRLSKAQLWAAVLLEEEKAETDAMAKVSNA